MTDEQVKYLMMLKDFNSELMDLNIKYSEDLTLLRKQKKDSIEFIERYLSLDLDDFNEFNVLSLLMKLREILTRGDSNE